MSLNQPNVRSCNRSQWYILCQHTLASGSRITSTSCSSMNFRNWLSFRDRADNVKPEKLRRHMRAMSLLFRLITLPQYSEGWWLSFVVSVLCHRFSSLSRKCSSSWVCWDCLRFPFFSVALCFLLWWLLPPRQRSAGMPCHQGDTRAKGFMRTCHNPLRLRCSLPLKCC